LFQVTVKNAAPENNQYQYHQQAELKSLLWYVPVNARTAPTVPGYLYLLPEVLIHSIVAMHFLVP
jgi:hypothetical protein